MPATYNLTKKAAPAFITCSVHLASQSARKFLELVLENNGESCGSRIREYVAQHFPEFEVTEWYPQLADD